MKFRNKTETALSFKLANVDYKVGVGEFVVIPDRYAYAVALHGLPLVEVTEEPVKVVAIQPVVTDPIVVTKKK